MIKNINSMVNLNYMIGHVFGLSSLNMRMYCSSTGFRVAIAESSVPLT